MQILLLPDIKKLRGKMIQYHSCPVCRSTSINKVLAAKDYTVSAEIFPIMHCNNCLTRFTQNIPDEDEIGKFYASESYISHSDTREGFINRLYHKVRKHTLGSKKRLVIAKTKKSAGNILDIGTGTGAFLNEMLRSGWKCTGIEPDPSAKEKAATLYGLDLETPSALHNFPDESFDAVTMWHVLEHVHRLHEYIEVLRKIIKPAGKIFIAVPNYTSYDAGYYGAHWAAYDVPRHLYHFSPDGIKELLNDHDLVVSKAIPMWFDSYYVSMLSEKYKRGKGNILRAGMIGLLSNIKTVFNRQRCSSLIYVVEKRR